MRHGYRSVAILLGSVIFLATLAAAEAQLYVSGNYARSYVRDADVDADLFGPDIAVADFKVGNGAAVSAGYAFDRGSFKSITFQPRIEGELIYYAIDVDTLSSPFVNNGIKAGASGDLDVYSGMLNVYADVETKSRFKPFFGAGFGGALIRLNDVTAQGFTTVNKEGVLFSWQLMAGIAYEVMPNLDVTLGYKYFHINSYSATDSRGTEGRVESVRSQNAQIGLRYAF